MYFNVATTGKAIQAKEEPHSTQAKSTAASQSKEIEERCYSNEFEAESEAHQ